MAAKMMAPIVELAARNNALWCDAVCRAHGRPGEFQDTLWLNRSGTPRLYPDAVTLVAGRATEQSQAISALIGTSRDRAWAVKDSFMSLDLRALGFQPLFDAEWISHNPDPSNIGSLPVGYSWADVRSEEDLAAWEGAWKATGSASGDVSDATSFPSSLLAEREIRFVAIRHEDRIVGGGILNQGAKVVGLSNLFARGVATETVRQGLVMRATRAFPGLPLVGYEHGPDLAAALRSDFKTIGAMRVWVTPD